ncbi:MAG: cache domain-containing protein, partial [Pseudomonadota bacterium]
MFFSRKGWISISLTIVVIFVALVVVLLGAVMAVNYLSGLRNTTTLVAELAQRSSGFVTDELRDHLDSVVEQSDWVAGLMTDDVVDPADEAVLGQVLLGALAATPQVAMLAFVDPEMTVVRGIRGEAGEGREVRIGPPRDPEFADRMQASARARDDGFWNEILYSERTQRAYVNYVRPVRRDGAFLGVVVALVSLNELSDLVSDVSNQLEGTVFILVERDRVIAHPNLTSPHPELSKASPTVGIGRVGDLVLAQFWSPETEPLKLTGEVENLETRQIEIGGERYILAHVTLDDYGDSPWIVGYHLNAENLESAFHSLHESALVGLVILALGIALAVFLGRKIARPIQAASSGAAQVAELEISELNELPRSPFIELDAQARSF